MEQSDSCQEGQGLAVWMNEGEGIKQTHTHRGMERDFAWGDG